MFDMLQRLLSRLAINSKSIVDDDRNCVWKFVSFKHSFNIILFFFLNFIRVNYLLFDLFYDILLIKIKIIEKYNIILIKIKICEKYNIRTCHSFLKNMEIFIAICFSHFTVSKINLKTYWTIRKYRLNYYIYTCFYFKYCYVHHCTS